MGLDWTTEWEYISTRIDISIYLPVFKFKSRSSGTIVEVQVDRSALYAGSKRGGMCPESVAKDNAGEH